MKQFTVIKPKSRDEWLAIRRNGIGSSEVGTILGLNPWQTPYQLWRLKKGLDAPVQENFAMKAGHYLEDAVAHFYADETGAEIIKSSAGDWIAQDCEQKFLQVSPDRLAWIPNAPRKPGNKMIVECKTTQRTIDPDNLPMHWFAQLQYQLMVMRLDQGALAWLTQGREFGHAEIARDDDFCTFMRGELERFWAEYIVGDQEPPCIDAEDVTTKFSMQTDGKLIEADAAAIEMVSVLKDVRNQISELESCRKMYEDGIKVTLGDAEAMVDTEGHTIVSWRTPKKQVTKFDVARFCAEHPELAKQYTTVSTPCRRFLVK